MTSPRLEPTTLAARRAIESVLDRIDMDGGDALAAVLAPLGAYLGGDACIHGYTIDDDRLAFAFVHGLTSRHVADLNASLAQAPTGAWARYNPLCPEPEQRDRALAFSPEAVIGLAQQDVMRKHGLADKSIVRALVCDGPSLLAWVGCYRPARAARREVALLDAIVPTLKRRLRLERRLESAELTTRALTAALERIAAATFVVSRGRVVHANAAGWAQLQHERGALVRQLGEAIRGDDPAFEVLPMHGRGQPTEHLVLAKRPGDAARARVGHAATTWSLTARQAEVLGMLASGHTNARIAEELGIAHRTVEVHVSAILDRAGRNSRSELIAAIAMLDE